MKPAQPQSEATEQGEQMLVGGIAPLMARDRLALRLAAPLSPRAPQKPCDLGLGACPQAAEADPWDMAARNQLSLF
jgi:hypothetical protein